MTLYCIGHCPPVFTPRLDFTFVTSGLPAGENCLFIPDDWLGDAFHGRVLSEYTQLFGLADRLRGTPRDARIYVFQYRKFLSLRAGRRRSVNMPYAFASTRQEAEALFPTQEEIDHCTHVHLLGPAIRVRSLAKDYASSHLVEDFCGLVACLRDVPGFDHRRVRAFVSCQILFPAPSLGVTSTGLFIDQMDTLRSAWGRFHEHYYQARDGYQRRVGGFLLERLHSFLIYEILNGNRDARPLSGHQVVVSEDARIAVTV